MPQLEVVFIINIKLLGVCFFNFKYSVNCDSLVKLRRNAGGRRSPPLQGWTAFSTPGLVRRWLRDTWSWGTLLWKLEPFRHYFMSSFS